MDHHDMRFLTCVPNFSSLAYLEVCQEPPILKVHTWRTLRVPDWILGGWGHCWHHGLSWYVILDLCAKFQLSSMNWSVSRNPHPRKSILEGRWGFLTGYFEDGVILDIMECHPTWLLTCVPNFSSLEWLKVCQEPYVLEVHTWRTLMVPDWIPG